MSQWAMGMAVLLLSMPSAVHAVGSDAANGTAETSAAANGDILDMGLEQLLHVKVSIAAFTEQRTIDAPGTVYVVSREEIRRYGWRDLKEILAAIPNLDYFWHWHWLPGGQRGFTGNFAGTLLLIDGREVQNLLANETFIVNDFPSHKIERVEVLQGPNSTLYGGNAAQGVINVVTRLEGGPDELSEAELLVGEVNTRQLAFNHKRRFGQLQFGLSGSLFASDQNYDELAAFATDPARFSRDPARDALRNLDPDHFVNHETTWTLNGRVKFADGYGGWNFRSFGSDKGMEKARTDFGDGDRAERAYLQTFAGYNFSFDNGISGFVELVHLRETNYKWAQINLNRRARSYDEVVSAIEYSEILPSHRLSLKTRWNYSFNDRRSVIWGYDGWRQTMGDSVVLKDRDGDGIFTYERTPGWAFDKSKTRVDAVFGQYSQHWNWQDDKSLALIAGVRYHAQSYTNSALLPRFGLVFKPDSDQAWKLTYGKAFRPPTSLEFEGTVDSNIDSQEMLMWELNHSLQRPFLGGHLSHSVALYDMTATNFYQRIFYPDPSGQGGVWRTTVSGQHRVRGIEELLQFERGDWQSSLAARWIQPDQETFQGRDYVTEVPQLKLKLGLAYRGWNKTNVGVFIDHWGRVYSLSNNLNNTGQEMLVVPAWTTLSLNANFGPYTLGKNTLYWSAYVENLTNQTYYHANARGNSPIQFQQAPRNFRLQFNLSF